MSPSAHFKFRSSYSLKYYQHCIWERAPSYPVSLLIAVSNLCFNFPGLSTGLSFPFQCRNPLDYKIIKIYTPERLTWKKSPIVVLTFTNSWLGGHTEGNILN